MCGNVSASWTTARADAGRIAAGDDQRALFAERLLDDLNQSFARLQRRRLPFVLLDQLLDERMRRADQDEHRLGRRRGQRFRGPRDRQRDAGGLEAEARGEIDDPFGAFALRRSAARRRDPGIRLLSESASAPVVRVERREIEVLFRAAARPARRRLRRGRLGRAPPAAGRRSPVPIPARASAPAPSARSHTTAAASRHARWSP